ncbi:Hsp90 protein-domain-containing protein [Mycotypha africana]|uniref:Hsp90 protein-domain-containing protein n=1 Tax=Mycotypha africana TaxID=64632 RepID=UPI0023001D00|nr:Hsp90 protein-domain-containing protein [Mycotypha africana]KAI8975270.1 Hsp90 protein-domain-containing protein [Mycotypha africana]
MFKPLIRSSLPLVKAVGSKTSRRQLKLLLSTPAVCRTATAATSFSVGKNILWSRSYSTEAAEAAASNTVDNKDEQEVITGTEEVHEFKTETKRLLDIVANSLYSEKEIFVRELISNAADALEKLRQVQNVQSDINTGKPLEIRIEVNKEKNQFIIQDFGIGMTLDELNENLGTIASSGSKKFLEKMNDSNDDSSTKDNIIGQFGVGFYSTFMVGSKIKVYTKSAIPGSKGYCWTTDGQGSYTVAEADHVSVGTKIVIELRDDCKSYASQLEVDSIIKKYSNFVGFPIYLNEQKVNTVDALWTKDRNSITPEQHKEFYRFIANAWDDPQFTLHFKTDSPISISSILYVPERHMEVLGEPIKPGVSLYSRKVLIQPNSAGILPPYLRFIKGVVDSEDIPLNVSRELLQDNILSRLRQVMASKALKWLDTEAKKDPKKYNEFFMEFGQFLKEGACTDAMHKREISKLLRFESSKTKASSTEDMISLDDYVNRRKNKDQKRIYYLLTPKRRYAEESPYTEIFTKKDIEVLYLYETVDEFVVNHLKTFQDYDFVAVDSPEAASDPLLVKASSEQQNDDLSDIDANDLALWIQNSLGPSVVKGVNVSRRLSSFPAVVLEHESPAMKKMMEMMQGSARMDTMPPSPTRLEINPDHPVMKGINKLRQDNPDLAKMVAEQIYDNALCAAGVLDDPRSMITRLNKLLEITVNQAAEQDKKVKV